MARSRDAFAYREPSPAGRQCQGCNAFHKALSGCHLFYELSRRYPRVFRLDSKVKPDGGCLAFEKSTGPYSEKLFMASRIVDAAIREGR